jgi:hypothetical protein
MTRIFVSAVIDAPIDKVWATVRDFNAMPDWHPRFSRSQIEDGLASDAIGCIRNFDIVDDGGTIREMLLMLSDKEHSFEYCILDSPLPVENYVAKLTLTPVTVGNKTLGVWVAEFNMIDDTEAEVVDAVANGTFGLAFKVLNEQLAG